MNKKLLLLFFESSSHKKGCEFEEEAKELGYILAVEDRDYEKMYYVSEIQCEER